MNSAPTNLITLPETKSGRKVARLSGPRHENVWLKKVFLTKTKRRGEIYFSSSYFMRLQYLGHRELICLETPDKAEAAKKAKLVYCTVHSGADGWKRVQELLRPEMIASKEDVTIGEYLEAVRKTGLLKESTLDDYGRKLRQVAAAIGSIAESPGKRRHGHRGQSKGKWRSAVESLPLRLLTEEAIIR